MTLELAMLLAAPQAIADPVPSEDEIVVIARRLDAISVYVGRDSKGRYTCSLSASSGNAKLDERLCRVSATCVRKGQTSPEAVKACVATRKVGLLEAFKRQLARSRS